MTINQKVVALISGLALASNLGLAKVVKAEEHNPNGWPTPDISTARLGDTLKSDIIKDIPGEETILRVYKTPNGNYFNTLSIIGQDGKEILYGFYVDTDGKPPMEYTLIDQEGDGVYRHKSSKVNWPTPKYLLQNQISKK